MLSLIIWWGAILLETLLLFRAFRAKLLAKYSAFYTYLASMFLSDVLLYAVYLLYPKSYGKWSYFAGFITLFLGCGVILECLRHVLSLYAGAEKLARIASFVVFGGTLCFAITYSIWSPENSIARATFNRIQRDFLFVQAILLLILLQLIAYYGISMGRNLKGMVFGYGQCVGATLITLAVRTYVGPKFQGITGWLYPISYLMALAIWTVALWSYCPIPVPESNIDGDGDYDALASTTRDMMGTTGSELVKAERL